VDVLSVDVLDPGAVAKTATGVDGAFLVTGKVSRDASDGEEMRKALTAALFEGHAVINLDNLTFPLGSPVLARAITGVTIDERLMGGWDADQEKSQNSSAEWTGRDILEN